MMINLQWLEGSWIRLKKDVRELQSSFYKQKRYICWAMVEYLCSITNYIINKTKNYGFVYKTTYRLTYN